MAAMDRAKIMSFVKRNRNILDLSDTLSTKERQPAAPPALASTSSAVLGRSFNEPHIASDPDLMTNLCSNLFKYGLHESLFSDVTVKALGTSYNLHRIIIADNNYLASKMEEYTRAFGSNNSHIVLELDIADSNVSDEAVQIIFRRLYGDFSDEVTYENILSVLATAYLFEETELCVLCRDFIKTIKYSSSNSLVFLDYASRFDYGYPSTLLLKNVLTYLCREGSTSKKLRSKTFPKMDFNWFCRIVQSDVFFVDSEYERFNFILQVLKIRFPNFAEYSLAIDGMNTNVLSLGKLVHLPSKSQAKAKRLSQASVNDSFHTLQKMASDDWDVGKVNRRSLYTEDGELSPRQKRSGFLEISTTLDSSPRTRRRSAFGDDHMDSPTRPHRRSLITDETYEAALIRAANRRSVVVAEDTLDSPVSPRANRRSVVTDDLFDAGRSNRRSTFTEDGLESPSRANHRRSLFDDSEPKVSVRNSVLEDSGIPPYNRYSYVPPSPADSTAAEKQSRRKSMFDPPSHHEFNAQNFGLFFPPNSASTPANGGSLPTITGGKRSRRSTLQSVVPGTAGPEHPQPTPSATPAPVIATNNSAHIEPSVALLAKAVLYCNMSRDSALVVRSEKAIPTFVYDRHFRYQCDLQNKIATISALASAPAESSGNSSAAAKNKPFSVLGVVNPIEARRNTQQQQQQQPPSDRSFMTWLMEEELCIYDGLDVPPIRFSAEFGSLTKFLKGSEKLVSETCFFAGSMWYLRLEATKGDFTISLGRKQSPYSPYHDTRSEIRFWCRMTCFVASTSAVTDAYTYEVLAGSVGLNGIVPITNSSSSPTTKSLFKELQESNQVTSSDGEPAGNFRIAVVLGLL
ncbi:hypothetical protein BDR26DRAFT_915228 [Obelidium mucronatum]|nr:hypothetical protein BDR26DRAFT_915228 [Obelidium mucronatum]